jgi:hypothetical protein
MLMRDLLRVSDLQLVQKINELEKYGPENDAALKRFMSVRSELSSIAWNSYAAALGCDAGQISPTGVMSFSLEQGLADRLLAALLESPKTTMRRDDFALGYMATAPAQCAYMNACNEYRELAPSSVELLSEFLSTVGPQLEQCLWHPFRIVSTRQFQLVPNNTPAGQHVDGWPVSLRKLFILPKGASRKSGTTWFRQRDGKELVIESEKPIWMIFENSVVWHAPISSEALRPTIELDIVPAQTTSLDPFYAGLAGWYPWFPSEANLLEGTRTALQLCYPGENDKKSWVSRLLRRAAS